MENVWFFVPIFLGGKFLFPPLRTPMPRSYVCGRVVGAKYVSEFSERCSTFSVLLISATICLCNSHTSMIFLFTPSFTQHQHALEVQLKRYISRACVANYGGFWIRFLSCRISTCFQPYFLKKAVVRCNF